MSQPIGSLSQPITPPRATNGGPLPISPLSKEYPIKILEDGRLRVKLSPTSGRKKHLVYRIKNISNDKRNIGSTTQTMQKRVSGYHTEWNNPVPTGRRSRYSRNAVLKEKRIAEEKGENKIPMTLKILKQYDSDELDELDLRGKENDWQLAFNTRNRKSGYNLTDPRFEGRRTGKRKKVRKKRKKQTNKPPEYLVSKFKRPRRAPSSRYSFRGTKSNTPTS